MVPRPNIVILLADDLGYGDVGYHGSDIQTPNIDALAANGVRMEHFHASSLCTPTRAGLLTGRWPIRYGLMRAVIPAWSVEGLPAQEYTIQELLSDSGYARTALVGKWHLGHASAKQLPWNRGFGHFYGHYNASVDYFSHEHKGEVDWHINGMTIREPGYTTDLIAREAVRFIEASASHLPFFLMVAFNAPHLPLQAKPEDLEKYPKREGRKRTYAAMVDSVDQAVGRVLAALDEAGVAQDTFVLFLSDNGAKKEEGEGPSPGDNSPFRGFKQTVFEGGVRVPAVVRWPAGGLVGGRRVAARMGYIDIYPTLKRVAGATKSDPNPIDGIDLMDVLRGEATLPDRDWYSFASMTKYEQIAVETDEWKLVAIGPPISRTSDDRKRPQLLLFRIGQDPGERSDVSGDHPEVVDSLLERLRTFRGLGTKRARPYVTGSEGFRAPKDWIIEN